MNFTVEKRDKYSIIKVETEKLGGLISPELKAKFVEVNGLGERNIILNMNNARYCDSSGLSAILVGNRLCKNSNGSFVMCGLSDMVQKLVNISQLGSILNITPSEQEAIDFLLMEEVGRELENE
jgi:anti-sigma B factor antagonist